MIIVLLISFSIFPVPPSVSVPPPLTLRLAANATNITLDCYGYGKPTPDVKWKKDGRIVQVVSHIESGHAHSVVQVVSGSRAFPWNVTSRLYMRTAGVTYADAGNYTCEANNSVPEHRSANRTIEVLCEWKHSKVLKLHTHRRRRCHHHHHHSPRLSISSSSNRNLHRRRGRHHHHRYRHHSLRLRLLFLFALRVLVCTHLVFTFTFLKLWHSKTCIWINSSCELYPRSWTQLHSGANQPHCSRRVQRDPQVQRCWRPHSPRDVVLHRWRPAFPLDARRRHYRTAGEKHSPVRGQLHVWSSEPSRKNQQYRQARSWWYAHIGYNLLIIGFCGNEIFTLGIC